MAHDLSRWFIPVQPIWFSERLAVYLQSVRFDPEQHLAIMGEPARWLLDMIRLQPRLDLEQLFAIERMPTSPTTVRQVYASSWALVDHLLNVHDREFGEFQEAISRLVQGGARAAPPAGHIRASLLRGAPGLQRTQLEDRQGMMGSVSAPAR